MDLLCSHPTPRSQRHLPWLHSPRCRQLRCPLPTVLSSHNVKHRIIESQNCLGCRRSSRSSSPMFWTETLEIKFHVILCLILWEFLMLSLPARLVLGSGVLWQDVPGLVTMAHNPSKALYICTLLNSTGHSTSYAVYLSAQPLGCYRPQPPSPLQPTLKSGNPPPPPATGMLLFLLA